MSEALVCSFCGFEADKSLIIDCGSVQSCTHCGSVLKDEQVFSHDSTTHDFSGSFANSDGSHRYGHGFNELQRARLPPNEMSNRKKKLRKLINSVCSKLQLSSEIVEQIQRFVLDEVNDNYRFKMSHTKIGMIGGCVYIICRTNDMPLTMGQIGNACGCSRFIIGGYVKMIDSEFNLHQAPITLKSLIPIACSYVPKSKECEDFALQLAEQSCAAMVLQRLPLPQAIAHTVIVSLALNKGTKQLPEAKRLCEKMSHEAVSTVVFCINSLKRYMMKVLEEIPWIDMKYVKITNVHHYIKDIIKYRKNVGVFAAETGNPTWFHKKEKKIENRKEKIKNAQERIRLKKAEVHSENQTCENEDKLGDGEGASESAQDTCGVDETVELDEEDKTIEELLEMGCSPSDLEDGYYECLKSTTLAIPSEILEHEIESYVRSPEEVQKLKRIADKKDAESIAHKKKRS